MKHKWGRVAVLAMLSFLGANAACKRNANQDTNFVTVPCGIDIHFGFLGYAQQGDARYSADPPPGVIRIEYGDSKRAGFWRADKAVANEVVSCLDQANSDPGGPQYKSSGKYPRYTQRIVLPKQP
jgi:hypothetical protein